jgi:hypothetical protein
VSPPASAPDWPPYFFDMVNPDGPGVSPGMIVPLIIDDLAHEVSRTPDWKVDKPGGSIAKLSLLGVTKEEARIGFAVGAVEGVIALDRDPAGWLRIVASVAGAEVFRAYLEQIWEEHELWPAGAEKTPESPGRMGKKRNWLSLHSDAWPALRPLANEGGWVNLMAMHYLTVHVRILGGGANVWRPFKAVPSNFAFELIAPEGGSSGTETCEFQPGDTVRCEMRTLLDGDAVAAVALES